MNALDLPHKPTMMSHFGLHSKPVAAPLAHTLRSPPGHFVKSLLLHPPRSYKRVVPLHQGSVWPGAHRYGLVAAGHARLARKHL